MKYIVLFVFLFCISSVAYCQNGIPLKFLRVNSDFVVDNYFSKEFDTVTNIWKSTFERKVSFGNFSPAYEIQKNRHIHKLEISSIDFRRHRNQQSQSFWIGINPQYELDYLLNQPMNKLFLPYIGGKLGLNTYYTSSRVYSISDSWRYQLEFHLWFTAGTRVKLSERLNLDVNMPFPLLDFVYYTSVSNEFHSLVIPIQVTTRNYKDTELSSRLGNNPVIQDFRLRIGLGYKL